MRGTEDRNVRDLFDLKAVSDDREATSRTKGTSLVFKAQ